MAIGGSATAGVHASYIGIGGIAKKVKNIYIGVGGTAKQVKKAYIGVGGVAKLWYEARKVLSVYGTATPLGAETYALAGASVGNYALFAGGFGWDEDYNDDTYLQVVYAYNTSLQQTTPTALSSARTMLAGASNGTYAIFAGGMSNSYTNAVNAYNSSLTRSTPSALSTSKTRMAAGRVGDYALFAGGFVGSNTTTGTVNAYTTSLSRSSPTSLSTARCDAAAANAGTRILIAGGITGASSAYTASVECYSSSITKVTPAPSSLSVARRDLAGASAGDYAVFAGGYGASGSGAGSKVDAYTESFVQTSPAQSLFNSGYYVCGASLAGYAIFALGGQSNTKPTAYDGNLVRYEIGTIGTGRYDRAASATVGNYALFAGGALRNSVYSDIVDVIQAT